MLAIMKAYITLTVLCMVQLSWQQPPGVPPPNPNPPAETNPGHGHGHGHGHHAGKPLEFASEVHNADHIIDHLSNQIKTKSKEEMTEEELEFHYFKLHDYDNNNKLDGVEIGKALTHFHEDENTTETDWKDENGNDKRVITDEKLAEQIDSLFTEYDLNSDGYVEFFEYKKSNQQRTNERAKQTENVNGSEKVNEPEKANQS